ncbi:MAG TPA: glycosyltransferase family 4 protein, partial [Chitinophagales bacterium]|nr:glycosyltransferase family 4 protein [Chitinophagales bacterium]
NVERFWSDIFAKRLEGLLTQKDYDLVIMEGGYLMQYAHLVKQHSKAKIVFRPHNLEYIIWERLAETEKGVLLPWYYGLLARRMRAYEVSIMNEANFLAPVSANNRDMFVKLGCTLPAMVIPIGYSFDELPKISDVEENAILFLGGMDWIPNREGVEWFIDSVWPLIKAAKPGAKFYLAGRNFPEKMLQLNIDGIKVLGEVDDAKALLVSVAICIVPLMAGSGMRVKIIEAMALGRAIVSTTVGAEGVDYTDGKDILIADEPKHFAQALLTVLNDSEKRRELGINAQQLVKDKYDNLQLCRALIDFCHS